MAGLQLADFLKETARRPFAYGRNDCLLWLADWSVHRNGCDPGARWRGKCSTKLGAARILKRHGGMVAVTGKSFEECGWRRTTDLRRGDVAIVDAREGLTGAIYLGNGLFAMPRFDSFIQIRRVPFVAAWTWEG